MVKKYISYKDCHKLIDSIEYKLCRDCITWFIMNEENFKVQPSQKDGYSQKCRKCQEKYNHQVYMNNREKNIEDAKQWMKNNYERHRELHKKYERTEKHKEYRKRNHADMRDKGWFRNWHKAHPEKAKEYMDNHNNHDISTKEWEDCQEIFNWKCAYCWKTLEEQYEQNNHQFHKEHVDNDGYNDLRNCVPSCTQCNSTKKKKSIEELMSKNIIVEFTQDKYNKIIWWTTEGYKNYIKEKPPYKITRKQNEGSKTYHFQLWTVDEKRYLIECIFTGNRKKDVLEYINKNIVEIKT